MSKKSGTKSYSAKLREKAVRLVTERRKDLQHYESPNKYVPTIDKTTAVPYNCAGKITIRGGSCPFLNRLPNSK